MRAAASVALLFAAGFAAAQESSVVVVETSTTVVPEETTTVWVSSVAEETESVTLVPVDVTSWVRYWPEADYSTLVSSTIYGLPNATATGWDDSHPTAAAGRAEAGGSFAAFIGFGVAGLLLL